MFLPQTRQVCGLKKERQTAYEELRYDMVTEGLSRNEKELSVINKSAGSNL